MAERKMIYLDDAINALERKKDKKAKGDIGGFYNKIIQNDIDALMQLPPAQPERNRGKWIVTSKFEDCYYAKCSECKVTQVFYYNKALTNYCPNCGAAQI